MEANEQGIDRLRSAVKQHTDDLNPYITKRRLLRFKIAYSSFQSTYIHAILLAFRLSIWANNSLKKILLSLLVALAVGGILHGLTDLVFAAPILGLPNLPLFFGISIGLTLSFIFFSQPVQLYQNIAETLRAMLGGFSSRRAELTSLVKDMSFQIDLRKPILWKLEKDLSAARKRLQAEIKSSKNRLLSAQLRHMDGIEFEKYLQDVFLYLGAKVKDTPVTGDQGADLIVEFDDISIAIQAKKRFKDTVGSKSIQEAHMGKSFYKCDYSDVITNSKFTYKAIEAAEGVDCILIDGSKLESLIKGDYILPGMDKS